MKIPTGNRFLAIYSGAVTAALLYTITIGAAPRKTVFDEIDVKRINIVEPDGTLRLIISDNARFPGLIIKGKEYPHDTRKTGGILFFNDEGTENGGLTYGGMKDKDGKESSYGHISFDKYMQDQVLTIDYGQDGAQERTSLAVWDRPNYPITELVNELARVKGMAKEQRDAAIQSFIGAHGNAHQRVYLGRAADRSVALRLKDTEGHDRIVIKVNANGAPVLQFLDEKGQETAHFPQ